MATPVSAGVENEAIPVVEIGEVIHFSNSREECHEHFVFVGIGTIHADDHGISIEHLGKTGRMFYRIFVKDDWFSTGRKDVTWNEANLNRLESTWHTEKECPNGK